MDNAQNKDSVIIAGPDSVDMSTEVAETAKELNPPPPVARVDSVTKYLNKKTHGKKQAHQKSLPPRAKLDSVALRQNRELPFKNDN